MTGLIIVALIIYIAYQILKAFYGALFDFIFKDFKK